MSAFVTRMAQLFARRSSSSPLKFAKLVRTTSRFVLQCHSVERIIETPTVSHFRIGMPADESNSFLGVRMMTMLAIGSRTSISPPLDLLYTSLKMGSSHTTSDYPVKGPYHTLRYLLP